MDPSGAVCIMTSLFTNQMIWCINITYLVLLITFRPFLFNFFRDVRKAMSEVERFPRDWNVNSAFGSLREDST